MLGCLMESDTKSHCPNVPLPILNVGFEQVEQPSCAGISLCRGVLSEHAVEEGL